MGDDCLKKVADIFRAQAGPMDLVARTEGDGLALVFTGLKSGFPAEHVLLQLGETFREPIGYRMDRSSGMFLAPALGLPT